MSTIFPFDPFATKDLITLPGLDSSTPNVWHGFKFDGSLENDHFSLAEGEEVKLVSLRSEVLKLSLDDFSLPDLNPSIQSSIATSDDDEPSHDNDSTHARDSEDIWRLECVQTPAGDNRLVSWDRFLSPEHNEGPSIYLSEAGVATFDRLLRRCSSKGQGATDPRYAKRDIFLNALFDLGLGRSSTFFAWNEELSCFTEMYNNYTLSGFSEESIRQITKQFSETGTSFRLLEQCGHIGMRNDPVRVALKAAIASVLHAVRQHVEERRYNTVSLARLLGLYDRPAALIKLVNELMQAIRTPKSPGQLPSAIITFVEHASSREYEFEHVLSHIVSRVLQPLLKDLYGAIGLIELPGVIDDKIEDILLDVLPTSTVDIFTSARASLRALCDTETHRYDVLTMGKQLDDLIICDSWDLIVTRQEQAIDHEQRLKELVLGHSGINETKPLKNWTTVVSVVEGDDVQDPFLVNFDHFKSTDHLTQEPSNNLEDPLQVAVSSAFSGVSGTRFELTIPCRMALDLSVTPFLKSQHRLLSHSVIHLLFSDHHLIGHLDIFSRFQLLGDGRFTSRLSKALFDPEQNSGEGRRKTTATTGLRLHSRGTWPPASSELRLVLMGILSESLATKQDEFFLDSISFAIRDLSDEDLEKCRDVNSIHALDFLRLHYKPPNPILYHIITTHTLEIYDKIFNHLLRLLRLKTLTQSLVYQTRLPSRQNRSSDHTHTSTSTISTSERILLHEFHHFTTTIYSYSLTTAILTPRLKFTLLLQDIQHKLNSHDYEAVLSLAISLDQLRHRHESMLQQIETGLLLGYERTQLKARRVVDGIMALVLRYASTRESLSPSSKSKDVLKEFRGKVIDLLRLLEESDKMGAGGAGSRYEDANGHGSAMLGQLKLRLDFNGFYSQMGRK